MFSRALLSRVRDGVSLGVSWGLWRPAFSGEKDSLSERQEDCEHDPDRADALGQRVRGERTEEAEDEQQLLPVARSIGSRPCASASESLLSREGSGAAWTRQLTNVAHVTHRMATG